MASRINVPPITRGLLLGLLAFTALDAGARYRAWAPDKSQSLISRQYYPAFLVIVPGLSIVYPWVFATATLAEQNIFGLLFTGVTLFYGGRYLERAWSSREYLKFILLIVLVPNVVSFFAYIALFAVTRNESLVTTGISGGIAIQGGFLVAFKQLIPEHTVTVGQGIISMRVKHFPAIFLIANTISGIAFGTDTAMILAWVGLFASWTYLRFYRTTPLAGGNGEVIRGDASDTFAFADFLPEAFQPPVVAISEAMYQILVALRLCTPFSAEDVDLSNQQASARGQNGSAGILPTSERRSSRREEADRRRAVALRALDQRLQNASAGKPTSSASASLNEAKQNPDAASETPALLAQPDA